MGDRGYCHPANPSANACKCSSPTDSTHSGLDVMALVLGIASTKGGSGKTTLAINLARAIQLKGYDVQVVDTDPQRTAVEWGNLQPDGYQLPVRHVEDAPTAVSLHSRLMLLEEEADVSVIDGSPKSDGTTEALVRASHAVLIPIQPTPADIWAARSVVEIINRIGTPAGLVISRQIVGTNLANAIADELRDRDLPVFESRVSQRVAYAETMMDGITVMDRSQASKARQEVEGVAGELINLIRRHHDTDAKGERDQ